MDKRAEADSIIKNHVVWSMGGGALPIPILDMLAVTAIQMDMVKQLARVYGVDYKETQGKALVTTLSGSALGSLGKRAVKFIPGIGSILGGITMAAISGASTYALGEVFAKHFETGGTFLDFDPGRLKKYYDEKFEKGKEVVDDWKKDFDAKKEDIKAEMEKEFSKPSPKEGDATVDLDVIKQLRELGQLKNEGVITNEEFEILKKKIIG